jgi:uncharacterized membrane protein (DUF2068 family)
MSKRPKGLILIICYKSFTATLFLITAISIFLSLKNHDALQEFSDVLALEGKKGIVSAVLNKFLGTSTKTIALGGVAAVIYSFISALEAIGLWFQKKWAEWLVIAVVAISIPPEIFELTKGFSWIKLIIFALNIVILIYLLGEIYGKEKKQ